MLAAVKKGRPVNEADIPPPVATGASSAKSAPAVPQRPPPPVPSPRESTSSDRPVPDIVTPGSEEGKLSSSTQPTRSIVPSPKEMNEASAKQPHTHGLSFRIYKVIPVMIQTIKGNVFCM